MQPCIKAEWSSSRVLVEYRVGEHRLKFLLARMKHDRRVSIISSPEVHIDDCLEVMAALI